jgi:hypothetical protein
MKSIVIDYLAEELKKAEPVIDFLAEELCCLPGFDIYGIAIQKRSGLKARGASARR